MYKELLSKIKFGKGKIDNIDDAEFLLQRSYTPSKLIKHFVLSNEVMIYVLAKMANEKIRLN